MYQQQSRVEGDTRADTRDTLDSPDPRTTPAHTPRMRSRLPPSPLRTECTQPAPWPREWSTLGGRPSTRSSLRPWQPSPGVWCFALGIVPRKQGSVPRRQGSEGVPRGTRRTPAAHPPQLTSLILMSARTACGAPPGDYPASSSLLRSSLELSDTQVYEP